MSSGLMLDGIIMNIFIEITQKSKTSHQEHFFYRFKDDAIQFYKGSMQDFTWKTTIADTKRTLSSHHLLELKYGENI